MIPGRQLAAVIWIAILTVVIQLSPAPALAHAGHSHARTSIAANDRANNGAQLDGVHAANGKMSTSITITKPASDDSASVPCTCNGGSCANGFSCCAPAVLADSIIHLPILADGAEVLRLGAPMLAGIDPEALPKPPKSFI
jgi:hypothetical protein